MVTGYERRAPDWQSGAGAPSLPSFQSFDGTRDHAMHRSQRKTARVLRWNRGKADRRSFGVTAEDLLEESRQLLAGWTVRHLVAVAAHFHGIEYIHVDMYVDLVDQPTQAIELSKHGGCSVAQVIDRQLF